MFYLVYGRKNIYYKQLDRIIFDMPLCWEAAINNRCILLLMFCMKWIMSYHSLRKFFHSSIYSWFSCLVFSRLRHFVVPLVFPVSCSQRAHSCCSLLDRNQKEERKREREREKDVKEIFFQCPSVVIIMWKFLSVEVNI